MNQQANKIKRKTGNETVFECRNVSKVFTVKKNFMSGKRRIRAVDEVYLDIQRSEVFAIVGESGCGKTTLAKILLGLLTPTNGEMLYKGEPIHRLDRRIISRSVQPIFQDPYSSLNPRKTINAIISFPLSIQKMGTKGQRRRRVENMMELVGLPRRLQYSYPSQLSGGQRQRVAIARALVTKPDIVICDEPTSALDVSVQAQILNLLIDLRSELNLTYVFISHNLAVVDHMATRVAVMYLGRIVEFGDAVQVLRQPRHPYTQALLESILTPDPHLDLPEVAIGAGFPNPLDVPPGCAFHPRCVKAMEICKSKRPQAICDATGMIECHLCSGSTVE